MNVLGGSCSSLSSYLLARLRSFDLSLFPHLPTRMNTTLARFLANVRLLPGLVTAIFIEREALRTNKYP